MTRHESMSDAAQAEARARALRYARDQREQAEQQRAERERAEQLAELVPRPRQQADHPDGQARPPATDRVPAAAAPRRAVRQAVSTFHCPDCHAQLTKRPRLGADARCEQCRRHPRRKTHRQTYDALVGDWPD